MSVDNTWTAHPAADLFPMMSDAEIRELADDIAANGQLQPVWLTADGLVLDGRNRLAACELAGVTPKTETFRGDDPVQFAVALNIKRRHLTTSQRAMLATAILPLLEEQARQRRAANGGDKRKAECAELRTPKLSDEQADLEEPGPKRQATKKRRAADDAAAVVGASPRSVQQAKRVEQQAPDLAEKVTNGEITLDRADRIIRDRQAEEQRRQESRQRAEQSAIPLVMDLRVGDFRDVLADLRDVDAIITDPPYPREYLPLLADLAKWADQALKPDGVLAVMMGQSYLPEVHRLLDGHRPYRWTLAYLTPGGQAVQIWDRKVNTFWKPILVYQNEPTAWLGDVARSNTNDNDKAHHHWGQSVSGMTDLLQRLVKPAGLVVDPFLGAGTTAIAARDHDCHFIGCDIDANHVATTRDRL